MSVKNVNHFSNSVFAVGISAGLGAVVSAVCSANPVTGALFGATHCAVRIATFPIFEKMFHQPGANSASRFLGTCLKIITPIAIATTITSALGFPITLGASAAISTAPLLVALTVSTVALSAIFAAAMVSWAWNNVKLAR